MILTRPGHIYIFVYMRAEPGLEPRSLSPYITIVRIILSFPLGSLGTLIHR